MTTRTKAKGQKTDTKVDDLVRHYGMICTWSEEDEEYVARCHELPSLSWLSTTRPAALNGLEKVLRETLADMLHRGEEPPTPIASRNLPTQQKITVRLPSELHRRLIYTAEENGVSLNQLITQRLAYA